MNTATSRIVGILGATNTGKTHYAIERLLAHKSGIIGLPLRLLAREVYDKLVAQRGKHLIALITGEEKIIPRQAMYYVCTVESMPLDFDVECVAIDEIQLCADTERGYIFTDRLLHARGTRETLFMGALTMRARLYELIPDIQILIRERLSKLAYTGRKKLSRLPPRSAIVAFSADNVYSIAELIRRQKGGAAIVMGALSPRTRNAQVELYQNGDVDYIIATDAIGMGLNMDISHVAFAGLNKYDGQRHRPLNAQELAQIAGRAGRYLRDGTFGLTAEATNLDEELVFAIEDNNFPPVKTLQWRNTNLNFKNLSYLLQSLETPPAQTGFMRAREADDINALRTLLQKEEVNTLCQNVVRVKMFWEVCQIPDFRKTVYTEHTDLIEQIFSFLCTGSEKIPEDWMNTQINRVDKTDGNIDTLSKRLAYIRTFTYIANRSQWLKDPENWREITRAIEDKLSDALHERLTEQFIDRRTHLLMRRLKQKETLVTEVQTNNQVTIEGQTVGHIDGFRFIPASTDTLAEGKTLQSIGAQVLQQELSRRINKFYSSPDTEIEITEQGGLMWGECAVGRLEKGHDILSPVIKVFVDDFLESTDKEKAKRRLEHFVQRRIDTLFEPLINLKNDDTVEGLARGIGFRLVEHLGILPRLTVLQDMKSLSQEERTPLRKFGIRFGQYNLFIHTLLKPAPTRLRLILWSIFGQFEEHPSPPPAGLVAIPPLADAPEGYYEIAGYKLCGERAVRVDILERLADMIRKQDSKNGFEATQDMLSMTGSTHESFAKLMQSLDFTVNKKERPKTKVTSEHTKNSNVVEDRSEDNKLDTDIEKNSTTIDNNSVPSSDNVATFAEVKTDVEMETYYLYSRTYKPRRTSTSSSSSKKQHGHTQHIRTYKEQDREDSKRTSSHKGKYTKNNKENNKKNNKSSYKPAKIDPDSPFAVLQQLKSK